jgi:hypothetical protein
MNRSAAVDNFLFDKPDDIRLVMEILRDIVFTAVKDVEEQMKWRCPFYSKNGFLCYLNFEKKSKKVVLSFVEGFALEDKYGALSNDTLNVRKLYINSPEAINERMIRYYLKQAVAINKTKTKNFMNIGKNIARKKLL